MPPILCHLFSLIYYIILRALLQWVEPVSYTHLDVYKRQADELLDEIVVAAVDMVDVADLRPVSYTHLDVYKRQGRERLDGLVGKRPDGHEAQHADLAALLALHAHRLIGRARRAAERDDGILSIVHEVRLRVDDLLAGARNLLVQAADGRLRDLWTAGRETRIIVNEARHVDAVALAEVCNIRHEILVRRKRLITLRTRLLRLAARIDLYMLRQLDLLAQMADDRCV